MPFPMKSLLITGFLATSMVWGAGCSALSPHKFCEEELAETRAKLAQTSQLASNLSRQLQQQHAELETMKRVNAANVRREKEQAMVQIDAKREQLDQERFEIDRIRSMEQGDLEQ
jgi:hypothetical protein